MGLLLLFFLVGFVVLSKVLLHYLLLILSRLSMHLGVDFSISEEIVIALHELLASLIVQTALWEWYNQKTLNDLEYV